MSESKNDASTVPRGTSTRASRAKQVNDRNIVPPAPKFARAAKRKQRGAKIPPSVPPPAIEVLPAAPVPLVAVDLDDQPENKDPWWTAEREQCLGFALAGNTQSAIAKELGRERHTVKRWMDDPRFEERLYEENLARFKSSRQRRTAQTVRLTDKVHDLADRLLTDAIKKPTDLLAQSSASRWLSEYREQSRREDEIYGLNKQTVDVSINGTLNHKHKHAVVNLSFKDFLKSSMEKMGIDVEAEEIDPTRADEAILAVAERALQEGSFLEELVEGERQDRLMPMLASGERG